MTMDMRDFKRITGKALKGMKETGKLMSTVGDALVSSTRQRFKDEEGPDGEPWEKSGRAEAEGGQTLTDTGKLKGSITFEATSTDVAVGTNDIRAAIHQFGGEIKPKKGKFLVFPGKDGKRVFAKKVVMPERPFIGFTEDDEEEVKEMVEIHMKKMFGVK